MWKISGNGMTKPSYMYGTMHISGKMVFHLGDQFYDAMKEVDMVALELEPEAWLAAIFDDKSRSLYTTNKNKWSNNYGFNNSRSVPNLKGYFGLNTDLQTRVMDALMYDPLILNYLLFRYGDYGQGADYEENTWLDMHIYQTGKKLGKATFGLETYRQSSDFMKQARKEEREETEKKSYDDKDRKERDLLVSQMEPAYRRQDLDLIDSLNKKTSSPSFDKYILVERNKVFVANMDSIMKSGKSVFAGMGCAHLPGNNGVIEMLREMGYTVEPFNKGERGGKQRDRLDKQVFKRTYQPYTSSDKTVSFSAPAAVYPMGGDQDATSWISLDIPNGASFIVTSMRSFAGLKNLSTANQLASIDSILYEAVAGSIVSQKRITVQGYQGVDILNRSRRGDYQRNQILILPESILIMKLLAPGEKVKNGYGNEFFNSIKLNLPSPGTNTVWKSSDGTMAMQMPGYTISYNHTNEDNKDGDFSTSSFDTGSNTFYLAQRHTVSDPGFIDEDTYETNRFADVFKEENMLKEVNRKNTQHQMLPAVRARFTNSQQKTMHTLFVLQNLNYCVFSVLTEDSTKANDYFKSIQFALPQYPKFYEYADTSCHFKVQIPYEPKNNESDAEEEYRWYFSSKEKDKNIFHGTSSQTELSVPGNPEIISISFQRYHRFSDGDDSLQFINNREEYIKRNNYTLDKRTITWNNEGVVIDHVLSDTASIRKMWIKQLLNNKSLYVMMASYDSILGPSEFLTTAFQTFQSTDTVFAYNHFINMDNAYLDALYSSDSTIQTNARKMSADIDFSAGVAPRLRTSLRNLPPVKDDEQKAIIKTNLTYGLQYDTTATNINFIREEFYKNMDSAYYQMDLLRTLLLMKTKESMLAFKKMILDEPPIVSYNDVYDSFQLVADSLKLSKLLLPEAMSLISLDEYESYVYDLAATLVDSSLVSSKIFESDLNQLLLEGKNELKRINAASDDETPSAYMFMNYCSLLQPFRAKPEVSAFFAKAYSTKKIALLNSLAAFDLRHKVQVPDTVFNRIITKEQEVIPLYTMLYSQKATERFPQKYNSREALLKLYIEEKFKNRYDKTVTVDSVAVFHDRKDSIKNDKLHVYYCKYKRSDSKQWKGVIIVFNDKDPNDLFPALIESSKTIVLDEHENEIEELDLEYKQLVERNRRKRNFDSGYESYEYDWY